MRRDVGSFGRLNTKARPVNPVGTRETTVVKPGQILIFHHMVIQSDLFGMVFCDPFKRLSDLQLGDQKVTLNHLEPRF